MILTLCEFECIAMPQTCMRALARWDDMQMTKDIKANRYCVSEFDGWTCIQALWRYSFCIRTVRR